MIKVKLGIYLGTHTFTVPIVVGKMFCGGEVIEEKEVLKQDWIHFELKFEGDESDVHQLLAKASKELAKITTIAGGYFIIGTTAYGTCDAYDMTIDTLAWEIDTIEKAVIDTYVIY